MKTWWETLAETWEDRATGYEREADAGHDANGHARTNALRWRDAARELRAAAGADRGAPQGGQER